MDERQFVIFSFFSSIVLASVIDKSLTLLKNQNLAFAFSLLPLFLLVLFPITLSSQKSNSIKRSEPYASGVLRKAIEEEGRNRVLIHNNKTIDMRVIARKTAVAYFEETEAKDCPCPGDIFQKGRFLEQLKSNNFFLILKDGSLLAASKQIPGLTLLWQSPSESSAVFQIDQKELPEKNIFYQDYLKILLKASLPENADSRDPKE